MEEYDKGKLSRIQEYTHAVDKRGDYIETIINMSDKKLTIEFTKKQFEALLKAVFLGNFVANGHRDGSKEDPYKKDYMEIENYIFSLAPRFGFEKYLEHKDSDGENYFPSGQFEDVMDVHTLSDEYDEHTFIENLSEELGVRDFHEQYTREEIDAMSEVERYEKFSDCLNVYRDELDMNGAGRLRIDQNCRSLPLQESEGGEGNGDDPCCVPLDIESKEQILKRRKEIERDIVDMLKETKSDFSLQHVKDAIFDEEDTDAMMHVIAMFDRGGDASELGTIIELVSDAWNYFPHKALGGVSPVERR